MLRDFDDQPYQQAIQSQRVWTQVPRTATGLRQNFRMQPHPDIAQDQGDRNKQQPQRRLATTGANASLMQLTIGRLNAKTTPIGGTNPAPRSIPDTPGRVQQSFALVTTP